jgi:Flp pilus assembly pilin Flp
MMRRHRLGRDERGATIVEMAFVMLPLTITLLAILDLGYRMYLLSVIEGTLHRAARLATVGNQTQDSIDAFVKSQLTNFSKNATITITKTSYHDFSNVGKPEKITQDTDPIGVYNKGDCYEDANGNGQWDADSGSSGLGGSDDIVYYKVSVSFPSIVPVKGLLGWEPNETVSANTVLRNQPYASQTIPTIRCD